MPQGPPPTIVMWLAGVDGLVANGKSTPFKITLTVYHRVSDGTWKLGSSPCW
jgi:hypothetical protein